MSNKVKVSIRATGQKGSWPGAKPHVVWCETPGCQYAANADSVVGARDKVRAHKLAHTEGSLS